MENVVWQGHVRIFIDENNKKHIAYLTDGVTEEKVYSPNGFFENKAVNGLVDKLK